MCSIIVPRERGRKAQRPTVAGVSSEPSAVRRAPVSAEGPAGLIVDWGGVLTASLDGAMSQWARDEAVDYDHFRDVMRVWVGRPEPTDEQAEEDQPVARLEQAEDAGPAGQSPVHRLERGEIATDEFERALAVELAQRGSQVSADGLLRRMLGGLEKLQDDMLGMVRRARELGVRTALLSNSWGDHYPDELWDGLFDAVVISGRVGMRKPEPEIFRHACALLGLPPQRCVMVDDLQHNIRGAADVGMIGVLHRTYPETLAELEVLFGLPLG
jgi:epoxide hydrolase-like predicted phosphatase